MVHSPNVLFDGQPHSSETSNLRLNQSEPSLLIPGCPRLVGPSWKRLHQTWSRMTRLGTYDSSFELEESFVLPFEFLDVPPGDSHARSLRNDYPCPDCLL